MDYLELISKNDMYYIVVPILVALLPFVIKIFNSEKQWKYIKEKSSRDSVLGYATRLIMSGAIFLILYLLLFFSFAVIFSSEINVHTFKGFYFLWIIICYACIWFWGKTADLHIALKYEFKHKLLMEKIIRKIPVVFSAIMWSCVVFKVTINFWRVVVIMMIVYEIVVIFILESKRTNKYNLVKFYFDDNTVVENIDVNSIQQHNNWIIAKNVQADVEYRFRVKDIYRVEYRM